ncbi:MAG: hypothetical protein AB2A00_16750 [Myxococcota bacterium]
MMNVRQAVLGVLMTFAMTGPALAADIVTGTPAGPLVMNSDMTIDLPPDGVLRYTTITINGGTLRFRKNSLNTPVYLLATGDVYIAGSIDVSGNSGSATAGGEGGPGGYNGGHPTYGGLPAGAGHGPGGGAPGDASGGSTNMGGAAFGTTPTTSRPANGTVYGTPLLVPLVGGSGGGGSNVIGRSGGGGGGGAILIASNTKIDHRGAIHANGAYGNVDCSLNYSNHGSGGGVRLVAPVVTGGGYVYIRGSDCQNAGVGRIRIDTLNRAALNLNYHPWPAVQPVTSIGSFMMVFPENLPVLDIVEVAGTAVTPGQSAIINLPFGAPASQPVRVRATNFTAPVSYVVVLSPEAGPRTVYGPFTIDSSAGPAEQTVTVDIPANNTTRVDVWTQ